jgi:lipopolysaccharide biosynthesis regulator YciM
MESFFSFEFWLIVFLLALNFIGGYYIYTMRFRDKNRFDSSYKQALEFMVEGKVRLAVEKLKETVRVNSQNINAYIKLVTILRSEGLHKNAIRILKDLAIRANLSQEELILIKKNIALSYWEVGEFEKAEVYFEELQTIKSQTTWVIPYLLKIWEKKKEWARASELLKANTPEDASNYKYKQSIYKMLEGSVVADRGQEKDARIIYKEAIKIYPKNCGSYLLLGDSYLREDRISDAIKVWTDFCQKVPEKAYLVFARFEKALYETGQFEKIEKIYTDLLQKDENNLKIIIALSEFYRKKGEYDESHKILTEAQKKDIETEVLNAQIVKVLNDKGQQKEALKTAITVLDKKILSSFKNYQCTGCEFKSSEPYWICPKCGEWQLNI